VADAAARLVIGTAAIGMPYGLPDPATGVPRVLPDQEAEALVREALACGISTFDTAPAYGAAEERLGRALNGSGTVWTKIDAGIVAAGDPEESASSALDASLARLRRPRIELLQWHNWSPALLEDERFGSVWSMLKGDPRCAALGASTYGPDDAVAAVESGLFSVVQIEWNLLNQAALRAAAPAARQRGVHLAARSVLLQGVLTDRGGDLPPHLAELAPWRNRAAALATRLGMDLAAFSLRCALEHPGLDHVLVGIDAPGQARRHLDAAIAGPSSLPWHEIEALHAECALTDPRRWNAKR
jgi:aryl-alcohol dehydrogenase-like predicted oxidoreductase